MTTPHVDYPSFGHVLECRAEEGAERTAFLFVGDNADTAGSLTYGPLVGRARSVARRLSAAGARPGDRAVLCYPPGLDFVSSLFGCMYAGIIAVPVYPPIGAGRPDRMRAVAVDCGASLVLTTEAWRSTVTDVITVDQAWPHVVATDVGSEPAADWRIPEHLSPDSTAILQYTSGSTGTPRGVVLTHGNLLQNSLCIYRKFENSSESVAVIWLPPYHDMGLVGGILQPIFGGFPAVLLSPLDVLARPRLWLETMTKYEGTVSGGPNFAYDLCVRKVRGAERDGLDLRRWSVAFNGAEPVRERTLDRFASAFAACGFRSHAFYPCYGLAETTLFATGGRKGAGASVVKAGQRRLVGCGRAHDGHEVIVVDPNTRRRCSDGHIGEIWLRGPSVAQGYWRAPELSRETFGTTLEPDGAGPFLRTADLGMLVAGDLFVTGRRKEVIVVAGRNIYPHDVEAAADGAHPAVRPGRGAAFGLDGDGTEQVALVQEVRDGQDVAWPDVITAVRRAVSAELDIRLGRVVLVRPGTVPTTSSGKLRRGEARRLLVSGEFEVVADSVTDGIGAAVDAPQPVPVRHGDRRQPAAEDLQTWLRDVVSQFTGTVVTPDESVRDLPSLGVDSLAATLIRHRCEEELGVRPHLADLLQDDLATIARRLEKGRADPAAAPAGQVAAGTLSAGERALWLLHRTNPTSTAYHVCRAFRVVAGDLDALRTAFRRLIAAHPSLRSRVVTVNGTPTKVIDDEPCDWLVEVDASRWDEATLRRELDAFAKREFDLETDRLSRVCIFKRSGEPPVVAVSAHHLALDYWSFLVMIERLRGEEGAPLPAGDQARLVAEQAALMHSEEGDRLAQDWREHLAGAPTDLRLPTDRPADRMPTGRGARVMRELGGEILDGIRSVARQEGATPYSVLLAAWATLLGSWSGDEELVVGCPTSGRTSVHVSDVVGYFVNPVAVRLRVPTQQSFAEAVRHAHGAVVEALRYERYPFSELVARSSADGRLGRHPVFQTMCVFYGQWHGAVDGMGSFAMGTPGARLDLGAVVLDNVAVETDGAQLDLTLVAAEDSGHLALTVEYSDVFDRSTVETLLDQLNHVLAEGTVDPDAPLARLTRATDAGSGQLLEEATTAASAELLAECVHEWIEDTVRRKPEAIAVEHPAGRLTYSELNRRANRVAHRLRAAGVGPEIRVGVHADHSWQTVVAVLGVLKAGGAYVPLDPAYPAARRDTMVRDAGVALLVGLGSPHDVELLSASGPPEIDDNPAHCTSGTNAAYVIFTSGSSGRPKGVLVEHRGVCNLITAQVQAFEVTGTSTVLQYASPGFDASVSEIFVTLAAGGTLRIVEPMALLPGPELGRTLADGVTTVTLPPSVLAVLPADATPALRTVVSAGEPCSPDVVARWAPGRRLLNAYGPTEATVCATTHPVGATDSASCIGRPVAGVSVYVLGPQLDPVSANVVGEVYIGGAGVARGYVGAPGATAERFVPDPFAPTPGMRMYRTGDLARLRTGGWLEFLGRADDQVKLRGYRIEPAEIEAALRTHPWVTQAAVVRRVVSKEPALVGYLATSGDDSPSDGDLKALVRETLPEYMVPAAFVTLPELPRSPSGKLDRAALPAPDPRHDQAPYVPPATEQERMVAAVWQEVLGLGRVSVDDNFVDLGGNSFSIAKAHGLLQERLGRRIALIELFEFTTIRALGRHLAEGATSGTPRDSGEAAANAQQRTRALRQRRAFRGNHVAHEASSVEAAMKQAERKERSS